MLLRLDHFTKWREQNDTFKTSLILSHTIWLSVFARVWADDFVSTQRIFTVKYYSRHTQWFAGKIIVAISTEAFNTIV